MIITKHGFMRFKQRQKIKNSTEMKRKVRHAVERGRLSKNISNSIEVDCYLFDGFYYMVADNERLVTVFRPKKTKTKGKKILLEDIKIKEFISESRYPSIAM